MALHPWSLSLPPARKGMLPRRLCESFPSSSLGLSPPGLRVWLRVPSRVSYQHSTIRYSFSLSASVSPCATDAALCPCMASRGPLSLSPLSAGPYPGRPARLGPPSGPGPFPGQRRRPRGDAAVATAVTVAGGSGGFVGRFALRHEGLEPDTQ
jgi:hypothetical protein